MKRWGGAVRRVGLAASLLAGAAVFGFVVNEHYPISRWLFWHYAEYWAAAAFWTAACGAAGDAFVRRLVPELPASERLVGALSTGLLVFFLGMFACGLLHVYGAIFFFAWPLAMLGLGGRGFFRFMRRLGRHVLAKHRRSSVSLVEVAVVLFGLVGVGMVYFEILTPGNVAFDSRWYHLAIAEHYAAAGGVERFSEGWYQGALPHLASLIYTWAYLLPASSAFDRVELAAHLEFVVFLWTLFSIPVLVRWTIARALHDVDRDRNAHPNASASQLSTWAAVFVFPGIFLYDSSLGGAADHIAAFWAVPILLAFVRACRRPSPRNSFWFALPLAGALLTKYQSAALVAFPALAFVARVTWLVLRRDPKRTSSRFRPLLGLMTTGVAGLVLTSPHWLKNWIWYGDPIYPFLYRNLHVRPWTVDSANFFEHVFKGEQLWRPAGTVAEQLEETLKAIPTFSFVPHDWSTFHGTVPVFGSLFTLTLLPLPFLRKAGRLWLVAASANTGVFVWYWMSHQDRYLQALLPWMAVVVAGTVRLVWARGRVNRILLTLLVALQIIWGGDVYFLPTHAMLGTAPAKTVIDLLSSGYRKDFGARDNPFGVFGEVAARLPPHAKVLVHDRHDHLGIQAMSVADEGAWVGGISYGRIASPRAFYDQMRGMGVTHFLWSSHSNGADSLAGDLVFFTFMARYVEGTQSISGLFLSKMPSDAPPASPWRESMVAVFICSEGYAPGLYRLRDLTVPTVGPRRYPRPRERLGADMNPMSLVEKSQSVAWGPKCKPHVSLTLGSPFRKVAGRAGNELWVRTDAPPR